ncbi:MAG TPA: energy transducer TonB, partial [Polyangiaceae bacterium]
MKRRLALAVFFAAHTAFAQVIVAPRAHETKITYPERGHGDAVVVLEIVVSTEGHVVDWRVLAGGEPFLTAAKGAIESMAFDPATRDDQPITARMRIELPFHEQRTDAPVVIEHVEHVQTPKPKPKPIIGVEDVHVRGTRKEIGGSTISKEDVRDLPGAFGDAFRAID